MSEVGKGPGPRLLSSACSVRASGWLAAAIVLAWAAPAASQTVWELTPYRIRMVLASAPVPELTPAFRADLATDLIAKIDGRVGAAWNATVEDAPPRLARLMVSDLGAITFDSVPKEWVGAEETDKLMLVLVSPGQVGYEVAARELDVRTRTWNSTVRVGAWQLAKVRDAAFEAIHHAFVPLAQIVSVDKKQVALKLRATGFPPRDPALLQVRSGDLFRPVIRYNDRYGKFKGSQAIEWTFLSVEAVSPSGLACRLFTGFRSPLSARRRGRVEQLALALQPPIGSTQLVLQARNGERLVGYDVFSHPPDSKATVPVGRTDRLGRVTVPPVGNPLRVLLVKNGGAFLARLPVVPGMHAELTATIANDGPRLAAEGFVLGLQDELIDLVTRRRVFLTLAHGRIDAEELEAAERYLQELRALENLNDFTLYLTQQKKRVFSADKRIQARIDALFLKTQKLVNEHLNPRPIDELAIRLKEAKAAH